MEYLIGYLEKLQLDHSDIESLYSFLPGKGFRMVTQDELSNTLEFFSDDPRLIPLAPVFTDGHSDLLCVYISGPLKGFVCFCDHEEMDLTPRFSSLANVVKASKLYSNDGAWVSGFPDAAFDYPSRQRRDATTDELEIIASLRRELSNEENEDQRVQLAFNIMALTPRRDLSQLYPYLDHENMYIQERAIRIMGFYKQEALRGRLESLATTAKHNGKIAVRSVFKYWEDGGDSPFIW